MKRLLGEPLLHFLLLGAGLFVAYRLVSKPPSEERGTIVIGQGQVASMIESFARASRRPPTREELDGLLRDRIREEVYCREAVAMGLDKDDVVIRRRLRQKMEFLSEDVAAQADPTDADLDGYLRAHPDTFRLERRTTFRQVYLDPQRRGGALERDAARLLARLRAGGEIGGDSILLDSRFEAAASTEISKQFGEEFAAELDGVPIGRWAGPIESGFGSHLVYVSERTEPRLPSLPEVRDAVRREWSNSRRQEANETFYRDLLRRYAVTVELPPPLVASNAK